VQFSVDGRTVNAATGAVAIDRDEVAHAPLVVLLHGAGMDRSVWSQQTRWLAHHGTRALAVDLPGHGDSEGPALTSVGDLAAWAAAVADALGDRIHLIGHSMGAFIALEAAATSPDRIASVVLLGVGATMAAGSQRWNGMRATLPVPKAKSASRRGTMGPSMLPARIPPGRKSSVPATCQVIRMASRRKATDVLIRIPR